MGTSARDIVTIVQRAIAQSEMRMDGTYAEAIATEFHRKRNDMRLRLVAILDHWFDGTLKIDPHSEMIMQLTDAALGLEVTPNDAAIRK